MTKTKLFYNLRIELKDRNRLEKIRDFVQSDPSNKNVKKIKLIDALRFSLNQTEYLIKELKDK